MGRHGIPIGRPYGVFTPVGKPTDELRICRLNSGIRKSGLTSQTVGCCPFFSLIR